MKSKETVIKYLAIGFSAILLAISAYFLIYGWLAGHFESMETLGAYVSSFGFWAPCVLTMIQMMQVLIPILPGFLGSIVGAALFGAAGGFWVNYIGISAGSILAFWLAKRYGIRLVSKMINMEKYQPYIDKINKSKSYPTLLFISILLPLAPDDFLCYFSGLINMSSKKFIAIIILAKPWCLLFYSIFFDHFL